MPSVPHRHTHTHTHTQAFPFEKVYPEIVRLVLLCSQSTEMPAV